MAWGAHLLQRPSFPPTHITVFVQAVANPSSLLQLSIVVGLVGLRLKETPPLLFFSSFPLPPDGALPGKLLSLQLSPNNAQPALTGMKQDRARGQKSRKFLALPRSMPIETYGLCQERADVRAASRAAHRPAAIESYRRVGLGVGVGV